ncbi:hypothetical protein THAOC_18289, partial [Thalassiosira oceanica]
MHPPTPTDPWTTVGGAGGLVSPSAGSASTTVSLHPMPMLLILHPLLADFAVGSDHIQLGCRRPIEAAP